ncbi:MAG: AI-2E family transporter [Clostridia bacterium]|nr:AI-2E family transporter [Clostridia bacterium]
MEAKNKRDAVYNFLYYFCIIAIVFLVLRITVLYLLPFVIGGLVAAFARWLSKKLKLKCISVSSVFFVVLFYLVLGIVCGFFVTSLFAKRGEMINILVKFSDVANNFLSRLKILSPDFLGNQISKSVSETLSDAISSLTKLIADMAYKIPLALISIFVTVISSIYIAKDFDVLKDFAKSVIPSDKLSKLICLKKVSCQTARKLLSGYIILFFLTFAELIVCFVILKIPYPVILAFVVSLVDLLPILGVGTVLIPWGIIALLTHKTFMGVALLVFYLIITFIRNFAEPHIIGKRFNINPLFTLTLVFAGLKLGGVVGVIVLPFAAIVIAGYYKREIKKDKDRFLSFRT